MEAFEHAWAIVILAVGLGLLSMAAILWVAVCER